MRAAVVSFVCAMASRKCSVDTYSSLNCVAESNALSKTLRSVDEIIGSAVAPPTFEYFATSPAISASIVAGLSPSLFRIGATMPPSCRNSASRRCSGVSSGFPAPRARFCASATASCALTVSLLKFIWLPHIESVRLNHGNRQILPLIPLASRVIDVPGTSLTHRRSCELPRKRVRDGDRLCGSCGRRGARYNRRSLCPHGSARRVPDQLHPDAVRRARLHDYGRRLAHRHSARAPRRGDGTRDQRPTRRKG